MINENLIESGGGKPILDKTEDPGAVGDGRTPGTEAAAPAEQAVTKTEDEIAADKVAEEARVAALTPEEKLAEADAKIAEEHKDKTPEEIKALQEAARDPRTPEEKQAEADAIAKAETEEKENKIKQSALSELFKKYGVKTEAELAEKLNPVVETEEQKTQKAEMYTAALNKYAVDEKAFNNEELTVFNTLRKMPAEDLVYNQFKKDFTEANKGRVDGDGKPNPVTDDEIKDGFSELYHTESENKALKEIGKKNLDVAAKSILAPLEDKFNLVKEVFDENNRKTAALPAFEKFVTSTIADSVPKELVYGEGENQVKVTLNNTDLKSIEKLFVKNHYFDDFLQKGGTDEQRAEFKREIMKEILFQNHEAIAKVVGDVREGVGLKKGAVGAKAPFEEQKAVKAVVADSKTLTPEETGTLKKAFA